MESNQNFKPGQLVRVKQFDDFPALVGKVGKIEAVMEYMGVEVAYFSGDRAWHENGDRDLEIVTADVTEEIIRQQLETIEAKNAERERLSEALREIMHNHQSISIDTPLGEVVTLLQEMLQKDRSIAFKALGMDKVYAELDELD